MKKKQIKYQREILLSEIKFIVNETKTFFSEKKGHPPSSMFSDMYELVDIFEKSFNRMRELRFHKKRNTNDLVKQSPVMESPPKSAEYLIYLFIPKNNRVGMLGDLEEEYRTVYRKFGKNRASLFYWYQTIISIWPLVSALVGKLLKLVISGLISKFSVSE